MKGWIGGFPIGTRLLSVMRSALLSVSLLVLSFANAASAITIDNFSQGTVDIIADATFPDFFETVEVAENGLPPADTIGGSRATHVQDGVDSDPATAESIAGGMRFLLDNDENVGGLSYRSLGGISLPDMGGIELDILYSAAARPLGFVIATLTLRDTFGASFDLMRDLEIGGENISGRYLIAFDDALRSIVDLGSIDQIDLEFRGGVDYGGPFDIGNIASVPEPSTGLLLSLGLGALVWRRRRAHCASWKMIPSA